MDFAIYEACSIDDDVEARLLALARLQRRWLDTQRPAWTAAASLLGIARPTMSPSDLRLLAELCSPPPEPIVSAKVYVSMRRGTAAVSALCALVYVYAIVYRSSVAWRRGVREAPFRYPAHGAASAQRTIQLAAAAAPRSSDDPARCRGGAAIVRRTIQLAAAAAPRVLDGISCWRPRQRDRRVRAGTRWGFWPGPRR